MMKKGDMGIGTLILFIAFILVAAVAAGVLISTTNSLQSKALTTGKATQSEVGTSMSAIEIYAEDATADIAGTATNDHEVDLFYWTIKLASGSDQIKFENLLLSVNTNNQSSDYQYGTNFTYTAYNGTIYFNGTDNYGDGCNSTDVSLCCCNGTNTSCCEAANNSYTATGTINCSVANTFAYYNQTDNNSNIEALERSTFGIEYSLQSSRSINGYMVAGDVVKLCLAAPRAIGENEDVTFNLVPKVGSALSVDTTLPALMIDKRIYVYP